MAGMIMNKIVILMLSKIFNKNKKKINLVKEKTHKSGSGHRAMIMTVNLEL